MSASAASAAKMTKASNLRKRRFPYTQIACDECRRRKIKCTGENPCKGCRDIDAVCLFERQTRFRSADRRGRDEAAEGGPAAEQRERACPEPRDGRVGSDESPSGCSPRPGSSDYYLGLVGKLLAASGPRGDGSARSVGRVATVEIATLRRLFHQHAADARRPVLRVLDERQWEAVLAAYEEEIGLQYPFLDLQAFQLDIRRELSSAASPGLGSPDTGRTQDCAVLVAAIVLGLADPVAVRVAEASVEAIHAETVVRSYLASGVTPMDASVLILTSAFFFLNDREQLAWRAIGAAMRLLQELGHHSSDIWPSETGSEARDGAEKLFWAAYTMDRRLGYGLGFPFAIQDADIDHDPLFSVESPSTAYLKHMVSFCRIVSDVRYSSVEASEATRDYLDFRILGWRRNLPHVLQFGGKDDRFDPTVENRGHYRLRLTLYLRANQIRATIHMKWAVRAGPGTDLLNANNMAEVARDTIQILAGLADETDIYHSQHKTFNHYLETALSCLLLAVFCAQPADGASYLGDARAALDLVRRLSTDSTVSRRLFDKLRRVQDIVDRLIARDAAGLGGGHHHGAAAAAAAMDRLTVVRQQADVVTALEQADDRQRRRQRQEEEADDEAEEPAVGRDKTARVTTSAVPRATTGDALDPRPAPQPAGGLCPDTSQPADDYMSLMGFPELGKILDLYGDSFGF